MDSAFRTLLLREVVAFTAAINSRSIRVMELLGDDWWPYGIKANRQALETFLRYHFEQGLSKRRLTCEDIFVTELLNT